MGFRQIFKSRDEALRDLRKNYVNLSHPVAFGGINTVERWYGSVLNRKDITDTLATFEGYTSHKSPRRGTRNPVFLYAPRHRMEVDLLDISQHKGSNEGVTFLVMLIDCWTRFLWVRPIKRKTADQVLAAVHSIFKAAGKHPKYLGGDRGLEFTNRKMTEYCRLHNINYMPVSNYSHAPFVERVNRTFQKILFTWATENETYAYLPFLQDICATYNNRRHRILKMSASKAEIPKNHLQVRENLHPRYQSFIAKKRKPKFVVGDTVRMAFAKSTFARSYHRQFVEEVFRIAKVNTRLPIPTFTLTEWDGEPVIGNFYAFELTLVKRTNFRVEKVLKTRIVQGKKGRLIKEYLVRWRGWSPKYDEWITKSETVKKFNASQ